MEGAQLEEAGRARAARHEIILVAGSYRIS